ncbi:glycosyltransferase family 2 protein [Pusillimonas sp. DMV24BSW_D]|uniref:glycosyltransferase family 2 protein n=1 Tax=Neopusillimonas aestuarii TaxID=2716226 RepID=UPI00140E94F1|nr:glycosyltransferase family 2 protein [Pusillimonas sp. DMV24BSW_D]QIM48064.1 glycosyltransferase family 2 protein [Pusillimonas sp. DMV24BSW_D]
MSYETDITVVIPVYNNAHTLAELTTRLLKTLSLCAKRFEIIYINDGSRDRSLTILRELASNSPAIKVINLSRNFGQHPAICAGFEHANGNTIVLMDADLQDRPEDIVSLVHELRDKQADIIYTIKSPLENKLANRLTSKLYHYIFARIVGANVPLNIGTFRAFNKNVLTGLLQFKEANILYGPLMFYMGFNSYFIELPYSERAHGKSSYTFRKRLGLAVNSLISYTDVPHKLFMAFGLTLLLGCLIYMSIVVIQQLLFGSSLPSGSTLIILAVCFSLGSVMMSLGIIGSYVFRVYQETLCRPRYLVKEKINFLHTKN